MLTDAQSVDVRRWMGYPLLVSGETDYVYSLDIAHSSSSLSTRLVTLTATEESVLVTTYLDRLATLETDILGASANLDTLVAGPWEANPNEVAQRGGLFNRWRRDMAAFLGFAPGPGLGTGRVLLERC